MEIDLELLFVVCGLGGGFVEDFVVEGRGGHDVAFEAVYAEQGGGGDVGGQACGRGGSEAAGAERDSAGGVFVGVLGQGFREREDVCAQAHHLQRRGVRGAREEGGVRDEVAAGPPQRGHAARPGGIRFGAHQGVFPGPGVLPQDAGARPGESRRRVLRREANSAHVPRHLQCRLRYALSIASRCAQVWTSSVSSPLCRKRVSQIGFNCCSAMVSRVCRRGIALP